MVELNFITSKFALWYYYYILFVLLECIDNLLMAFVVILFQMNEDSYNTVKSTCKQQESYILELQGQIGRAQKTT